MAATLKVGLSADFMNAKGELVFPDIGLGRLEQDPRVTYEFFREHHPIVKGDQIRDYDVIITLTPRYTRAALEGVERLVAIGRFGVGYDNVDVQACTDHDVILYIASGAVEKPVAGGIITFMLALSRKLFIKDRITRAGRWDDRILHMGEELREKVLGSVGLGNIASELFRLVQPWGMQRFLAYDPYVTPEQARTLGVELVGLETVFRESDFLTINCLLSDETQGMVDERLLSLMKPTAYFINTARGAIVDQAALTRLLRERRIAGAGLDVFEREPLSSDDPLLQLDNVIVAPHSIAWTNEGFRDIGNLDVDGVFSVLEGRPPRHVVNREVLERPGLKRKLARFAQP